MANKFYINPRDKVSVNKALLIGKLFLIIFPLIGIISPILSAIFLADNELIPDWGIGLGIITGFIFSWFIWAVLITKWKIWAYSRVANINELKRKAIEEKLIWPDGSWFNKTEISTANQKRKLQKLKLRFFEQDVWEEDPSIPEEMIVNYGKDRIVELSVFTVSAVCGIVLLFSTTEYLLAFFSFLISIITLFGFNKKANVKSFKLNKEGITLDSQYFSPWSEIEGELVYKTGSGSSTEHFFVFFSKHGETNIPLNKYKVKPKKLEAALKTYRIRFNNNSSLSQ